MRTFKVRALRRVGVGGQALEPGNRVSVSAVDAAFLLIIGAVELVDADDAPRVAAAARQERHPPLHTRRADLADDDRWHPIR